MGWKALSRVLNAGWSSRTPPSAPFAASPRERPSSSTFPPISPAPFGTRSPNGASSSCTPTSPMPSTPSKQGRNVVVVTPTASGKTLCYNLPVLNRLLAEPDARAMYLFPTKALAEDQLHELQAADRRHRRRHPRLHLRRRYAAGCAQGDPRARQRRPDQSRHAAQRHPAAPHQVGQGVREPAVLRHRRTALLSRRLWQPPRQPPSPLEADLRVLRIEAAVHLLFGDHRESARNWPKRSPNRHSSWWTTTAHPAGEKYFVFYNPPVVNRAARHPPQLPAGDAAHRHRVDRARPADAGLRQQPPGDRGARHLPEARLRARATMSGRMRSADIAAAICRASAARSSASCATARSAPWSPPTRSNSASTSARSTRW